MASCHVTLISLILMILAGAHAQTMPTGCTYESGLYECDYSTLSGSSLLPLQASGFSPIPQRLRFLGLPTALNSAVFDSDFQDLNATDFDTNYPASLEFVCENGGDLSIASGFLQYMEYIEDFKITNCDLGNIPANAFDGLGDVDRFMIENGTVGNPSSTMLTGINIRRNTSVSPSYPKQHGAFIMKNTKITGTMPTDIFSGQSNIYEMVLRNIDLPSVSKDMFQGAIRYLDISYNSFGELPSDTFSDLTTIGVISLSGLDIECTCSKLWFLGFALDKHLTLEGDIVCVNSSSWDNKLAWRYYYEQCVQYTEACDGGISLLNACLTAIDLSGFSVGFIAFVMGWVVLGITIHTKRQMGPKGAKGNSRRKPGAGKKPPPKKGAGGAKSGWA